MAAGIDAGSSIPATNADLQNFVNQNPDLSNLYGRAGQPNLSVASATNLPAGNSISPDGLMLTPNGDLAGGLTNSIRSSYNSATGSFKSDIWIAPNRFSKAYKLYMTVGHELVHAEDYYTGNITRWFNTYNQTNQIDANNFARARSEVSAHTWSFYSAKTMHYNVGHYRGRIDFYKRLLPFLAK